MCSSDLHVVVTGPTGGSPNRLEIRDFVKNEKFFSLYIQALQATQKEDQSSVLSAFQIGGIHGLPYAPWNGVRGTSGFAWGGYCTHGSVLFPTWHRPYMLLYEQTIQQHAKQIAATYQVDPTGWKKAADDLRQPFWDWARNSTPPDEVIALKKVTIVNPSGQKVAVDNPLYHYVFHPIDPSFRGTRYSQWPTTLRQPTSSGANATDNVAQLKRILSNSQVDITSGTYNMLTRVTTWPAFSNHTTGDGGSVSNSLEGIHDQIHGMIGGHMGDPSVAAFDPIFYLHHCNVDRLLSLWTALHPGVWVSRNEAEAGTFTLPPRTPVDTNTPLTPFYNGQNTFWPSAATVSTAPLGYSYPDFNGLDLGNTTAVRTAISARVNQLYGSFVFRTAAVSGAASALSAATTQLTQTVSAAFDSTTAEKQQPLAAAASLPKAAPAVRSVASVASGHGPTAEHPAPHPEPGHSFKLPGHILPHLEHGHSHQAPPAPPNHGLYEWTARIESKQFELSSSYSVLIFLGTVPDDPKEWLVSPNFIGSSWAFVNSSAQECANCRDNDDLVIEGFVHLNAAIVRFSGLDSLEPDAVLPYLTKNLHWRVQKLDGEPATLKSLEVTIHATPLSYPPGAVFPVPGEPRRYDRVTRGHGGGSRHGPGA